VHVDDKWVAQYLKQMQLGLGVVDLISGLDLLFLHHFHRIEFLRLFVSDQDYFSELTSAKHLERLEIC